MNSSYVDGKIREALVAAKGSRATAQRLLITWAAEDPQLMLGIAQPFLKAIAAAAVERGIRQAQGGGRSQAAGGRRGGGPGGGANPALSKEALANVLSRLGRDDDDDTPLSRTGGTPGAGAGAGPAKAGPMRSATMAVPPRGGAAPDGVTHEKAMMAIAKAFVAKKMG